MLKLSRMPNGEPEIFLSLQGEGISTGLPSLFIRLATCNLHCSWCDTRYTWDWSVYNPAEQIIALAADAVVALVLRMIDSSEAQVSNVVITGGEPLLQQRELVPLAEQLAAAGLRIEVETNGTIRPISALAELVNQWNVSPKLANSGNDQGRKAPEALSWFALQPSAYLKLVIVEEGDLEEARDLVTHYGFERSHVLLMPAGVDQVTLMERSAWLAPRCLALGYRFGTRLHILLWGDQRGR